MARLVATTEDRAPPFTSGHLASLAVTDSTECSESPDSLGAVGLAAGRGAGVRSEPAAGEVIDISRRRHRGRGARGAAPIHLRR